MRFSIPLFVLATGVAALPSSAGGVGNGVANKGNTQIRFPVPDNMTVKEAQAKCGDQAQLSCCNKVVYAGDTTDINKGILAGTLGHLIGTGSGAEGLGLFDQCADFKIAILGKLVDADELIKKKCRQNIACCQNSAASANEDLVGIGLPCIAVGSLL